MPIQLSKETQKDLIASIKRFATQHLELDIGDLKAGYILDFCLKEIGPSVYNQAIADAQRDLAEKVEDLGAARHEAEFGFWPKAKR